MAARLEALYRVRGEAASIAARAQGIAVEQSVEMPLSAITEPAVLTDVVGEVQGIADLGQGVFEIRIGLALAQEDLAQLLGASRQRVNQELKGFERDGALRVEPTRLVVLSRDKLLQITER